MWLDAAPRVTDTRRFSAMPDAFRRRDTRSEWADANKGGNPVDSFIEAPSFDPDGNLLLVAIPFGRVFRVALDGRWTLISEYDGEPNGLKYHPDGRVLIADYKRGLLVLDPASGRVKPLLSRRNSEAFKGLNDLTMASNGDVYFTDQGQTGLHDPTGRVFRLGADGRLDCLMDNLPSPNGLVLSPGEDVLYVAMTRDNAVWRAPLQRDGSISKVGRFCSFFGTSGPDGLAMAPDGRLLVAHASLGSVFVIAPNGECVERFRSCAGPTCTNLALGGPEGRTVFITESSTATVLNARF